MNKHDTTSECKCNASSKPLNRTVFSIDAPCLSVSGNVMVNTTPIICDPKYSGRVTWSDSAQFEWEVLCYQMVILKDNYNVHFKF